MVAVVVSVPVAALFPGVTADLPTLRNVLGTLSRGDALFSCARLNLVLSNPEGPSPAERQRWAARRFLTGPGLRRLDRFAKDHGGANAIALFARGQLLELMRWAALVAPDQPDDGNTFRDVGVRRRFVQAALIAGEIWERRVYANGLNLTADRGADRMRSITSLRAGVDATRQAPELTRVLARSSSTYHTRLEELHPGASSAFTEATGLTFFEYTALAIAFEVAFCRLTPASEDIGPKIFDREQVGSALRPEAAAVLPKFLALESQSPDELRAALLKEDGSEPDIMDPFNMKPLYGRPILCLSDGRGIVLDSAIFGEKVALGALFHTVRALRGGAVNELFGAFGMCFEEYVQQLLSRIWPRVRCSPRRTTADGEIEMADAAVVVGCHLFLFEVKSAFIGDAATLHGSADDYITELREKYVRSNRGRKPVAKGVAQLEAAIRRIATDGYLVSAGDLDGVTHLNPIMIVRDGSVAVPGHAEFFSREFDTLLARGRASADATGPYAVAPLTVATVEDIEDLEPSAARWDVAAYLDAYTRESHDGARPSLRDFMVAMQDRYPVYPSRPPDAVTTDLAAAARFLYPEASNDLPGSG